MPWSKVGDIGKTRINQPWGDHFLVKLLDGFLYLLLFILLITVDEQEFQGAIVSFNIFQSIYA